MPFVELSKPKDKRWETLQTWNYAKNKVGNTC
jgi:hypothetical protein